MQAKKVHLKELCTARMGYTFREKPRVIKEGNVLVIQPKDVSGDGVLDLVTACRTEVSIGRRLKKGDVLLINRGRFSASVFDADTLIPCVATSAFIVITPEDPKQILSEYLALFYNSSAGRAMFKRLTETTTIPFISLGNLESIAIPVPPLERQKALVAINEMNRNYMRLCARKAELQQQIIDQLINPTSIGSKI